MFFSHTCWFWRNEPNQQLSRLNPLGGICTALLLYALLGPAYAIEPPRRDLIREDIPVLPLTVSLIDLTREADEIWDRIRNGFAMPDLNDERVLTHQQWYTNHPAYLRQMVERSRPYLHHIVSELERRNMPTELVLLPMVESSFDPHALSRSNASGLWQFIPSTGRTYNLDQNWWEDERRDVVASTAAALDYLQMIYDMHGDWHLALASYNWGEGAIKRAIAKNIAHGLPTDYSSLNLPSETRHYVPKLQALKNIFANPTMIDRLTIPIIPNRPFFKQVSTPTPIDIKLAAKLAGMSLKDFQALNPSHNRPVINDRSFLIPAEYADEFEQKLRQYHEPLQTWVTYTVKHGDKLDQLANRYKIPPTEFRRVNGLSGKSRVSPGLTLLVPAHQNPDAVETLTDWKSVELPRSSCAGSRSCKGKSKRAKSNLGKTEKRAAARRSQKRHR